MCDKISVFCLELSVDFLIVPPTFNDEENNVSTIFNRTLLIRKNLKLKMMMMMNDNKVNISIAAIINHLKSNIHGKCVKLVLSYIDLSNIGEKPFQKAVFT